MIYGAEDEYKFPSRKADYFIKVVFGITFAPEKPTEYSCTDGNLLPSRRQIN